MRLGRGEPGKRALAEHNGPGVGFDGPGDDLDQRALARAVLAEQRVHLAGPQVKAHPAQGADAGVGLLDLTELEQRNGHGAGEAASATARAGRVNRPSAGQETRHLPVKNAVFITVVILLILFARAVVCFDPSVGPDCVFAPSP